MGRLGDLYRDSRPLILSPWTTVRRACEEMRDRDAGVVLITDSGGQLIGIFSNRDGIRRVLAGGKSAAQMHLSDVMTHHPAAISPYHTPVEALRLMCSGRFRHLPVVEKGIVVGIISRERVGSEDISQLEFEREFMRNL